MIPTNLILITSLIQTVVSKPIATQANNRKLTSENCKRFINDFMWSVHGYCSPVDRPDPSSVPHGFKLNYYQIPADQWDYAQSENFWDYYDHVDGKADNPKLTPIVQRGVTNNIGVEPSGAAVEGKISIFEYTGYILNWGFPSVDLWLNVSSVNGARATAIIGDGAFHCDTREIDPIDADAAQLNVPHDDVNTLWSGTFDLETYQYYPIRIVMVGKSLHTTGQFALGTSGTGSEWLSPEGMKKWIMDPDAVAMNKPF